ncbi:MAG: hypothetical protein EB059_00940 [Alphaproteobacteria bacterium]|nr:hypothetical protein [Alphaproteobacteria bacterium]
MKPARFFMLDARAAFPVLLMLLHMRIYTMIFAVLVMIVFYFLEQRGLSFFSALRSFRLWIVTKKRPNYRASDMTRMIDFSSEPLEERFANEGKIVDSKNGANNSKSESVKRPVNSTTVRTAKKS